MKSELGRCLWCSCKIEPNKTQEETIKRTFGACRKVWNYFLDLRIKAWEREKRTIGRYECSRLLTQLKKTDKWLWLNTVDSKALVQSVQHLDEAFVRFFKGCNGGSVSGYPKSRDKWERYTTYGTVRINRQPNGHGTIRLPILGEMRAYGLRDIKGRILGAAVRRTPAGDYECSVHYCEVAVEPLPKTGESVGVDLGVSALATLSDGTVYDNPRYFDAQRDRLRSLRNDYKRKANTPRRRRRRGGNIGRVRRELARLHEHIKNQRRDTRYRISFDIVSRFDFIGMESLAVRRMIEDTPSHSQALNITDAGMGLLGRTIKYMASKYGKMSVFIDRWFASSQICSVCHKQNDAVKDTHIREWTCPFCGAFHNRDVNAAINILRMAQNEIKLIKSE